MVQRTDPHAKRAKLEAWFRDKLPSAEHLSVGQLEKAIRVVAWTGGLHMLSNFTLRLS